MKRLSLQWRITIMTALLTCAACVLTNCLVGYTGMRYMDAIGSNISDFNATVEDSPQAFDPTRQPGASRLESHSLAACWHTLRAAVHSNRYGLLQPRLSVCSLTT